ncbi:MAG: hypothetical protein U0228_15040 [Myxococcaceae bacterium]
MSDTDDFRRRVNAEVKRLPAELRDAVLRAMEKEDVVSGARRAWAEGLGVLQVFSAGWFEKARVHAEANELAHAIYACERALELRRDFPQAVSLLADAHARQDAGPWLVMQHNSYAREDSVVTECANRAAAEARVKELNAQGGDHHWATATT